jgi:hypothetical protein
MPLVVAPGHTLARRRSVTPADLLKHSDPLAPISNNDGYTPCRSRAVRRCFA